MIQIISTYSLLPFVGSVLVFSLGLFVWLKKSREWLHILFFLYSFTIALWLLGTFLLFNATGEYYQLFWDRFIYIGVVFIPVFLYHFGLIYCNILPRQRLMLALGYLSAFIFLPLSQYSDKFVSGLYTYSWGVHAVAHEYHHFFLAYFFLYFALFFVNLGVHYHRSTGEHKKQVRFVLIGYAILDIVGPLAFLPAYGIPITPIIFLAAIPFAGMLGYAIINYQALDVKTITAEVVVTTLNVIVVSQIFFAQTTNDTIMRSLIALLIFVFSLTLVRSVKKEVQRREEMSHLAESLKQANFQLQELDRQKTDFLSIAAHQLRTPLSIINGYIELIRDGGYGRVGKKVVEILNNMDESNTRLVKLVDDFLNITRIEQGRTKFDFTKVSIRPTIESVVRELKDRAEQHGLKLSIVLPKHLPLVKMDEEKIRHVIFNFVDNAIKYTNKGTVVVMAHEEDGRLVVKVKDPGFGFDKVDEANFFQKFYRGNNVKGTNVNGTGLGLYVCRKFIEAHNGRIAGLSPGLGKGSEFSFALPLSK